jgi:hypothetical protein
MTEVERLQTENDMLRRALDTARQDGVRAGLALATDHLRLAKRRLAMVIGHHSATDPLDLKSSIEATVPLSAVATFLNELAAAILAEAGEADHG